MYDRCRYRSGTGTGTGPRPGTRWYERRNRSPFVRHIILRRLWVGLKRPSASLKQSCARLALMANSISGAPPSELAGEPAGDAYAYACPRRRGSEYSVLVLIA